MDARAMQVAHLLQLAARLAREEKFGEAIVRADDAIEALKRLRQRQAQLGKGGR